jgi:hypothetical protein
MDRHDSDSELSPEERAAFAALPRERDPGDLLEERTVRRLRRQGLLAVPRSAWPMLTPVRAAVAAAAVLAVALGSFVLGQWTGSRQTTEAMLAMHSHDSLLAAREVQRAGTAYLAAVDALSEARGSDPEALRQGREVALTILQAAADQVVQLAPDDPVAGDLLRAVGRQTGEVEPDVAAGTTVVWF